MANILSNTGIISGSIVQTTHVIPLIDAFTAVEAYDITLSGSLTITGSLLLTNPIDVDFYGTSSTCDSTSYAPYSLTANHAITTSFADNETIIMQFTHEPINIEVNKNYFIGIGIILSSEPNDFTPLDKIGTPFILPQSTLISSSISANVFGDVKNILYDPILVINDSNFIPLSNQSLIYDASTQYQLKQQNYTINQGDKLNIYLQSAGGAGDPATKVSHNITLYIKING